MADALAGLKVLDMSRVIAGPFAAQTLGDLGAEVIKTERPGAGDDLRQMGPPWLRDGDGAETADCTIFHTANRNKRSLTLDFTRPEGQALARRLVAWADVLIENYKVGTLARYGLGYDDLKAAHPRLIYCSITGFGQTGPYAPRPGFDTLAQAMGGLMSATGRRDGTPGEGPTRIGVPISDLLAAKDAVIGILAALRHREATGQGQHLDIALLDSTVGVMLNNAASVLNGGPRFPRSGNDHQMVAPYGAFRAADGWLMINLITDAQFDRLATALDCRHWRDDPRFADNGARLAHRDTLTEAIEQVLGGDSVAHWIAHLSDHAIPCGPIHEMDETFADPQVRARDLVVELPHPAAGAVRSVANPVRLSETPPSYRRPAPSVGADTGAVLAELGYDETEIAALAAAGAI